MLILTSLVISPCLAVRSPCICPPPSFTNCHSFIIMTCAGLRRPSARIFKKNSASSFNSRRPTALSRARASIVLLTAGVACSVLSSAMRQNYAHFLYTGALCSRGPSSPILILPSLPVFRFPALASLHSDLWPSHMPVSHWIIASPWASQPARRRIFSPHWHTRYLVRLSQCSIRASESV